MERHQKRKSSDFQISTQDDSIYTTGRTRAQSRSQAASPLPPKSQPTSPLPTKSLKSPGLTVAQLKEILKDNNVEFSSKATKPQLTRLYDIMLYSQNEEPDSSNQLQDDTTSTGVNLHENQSSEEQSGISSSPINPVESNHPASAQVDNGPEQQEEARGRVPQRIEYQQHYQNNLDGEGTDTSDSILTQERQRMEFGNNDEPTRDHTGQSLPDTIPVGEEVYDEQVMRDRSPPRHQPGQNLLPDTIPVGEEVYNDQYMRDRSPQRQQQQIAGQNLPTNQTLPFQNLSQHQMVPVESLLYNQMVPFQGQNVLQNQAVPAPAQILPQSQAFTGGQNIPHQASLVQGQNMSQKQPFTVQGQNIPHNQAPLVQGQNMPHNQAPPVQGQNIPQNQASLIQGQNMSQKQPFTVQGQNIPHNQASPVQGQNMPHNQAPPVQGQNILHNQATTVPGENPPEAAPYDETRGVPDHVSYTFRNGYIRILLWDPQLRRDAEARVEGSIGTMFIMVSFDPIPRETGRPRRCWAYRELPIDPKIIPILKRGTKEQLKDYKGIITPQDAGYVLSNMEEPQQNSWRWHSFHGEFGVKGDPSQPTWFGFTDCTARYKKNTSAMFHRTWAWAGQPPPRAPRKGDERAKLQYIGYQLKDDASLTMWQRGLSETPVFSREATLVSPSPAPIKTALKSPGVKREPKSVSFKSNQQKPNGRFPVSVKTEEEDESDL